MINILDMEYKTLGDWCKWLEHNFSPEIAIPTLPVIIRLDGVNFHNWTKGLKRPYDENFLKCMELTTSSLVQTTNAVVGYTQSDEITLVLYSNDRKSLIYHNGKKQKIVSKLAAECSLIFNEEVSIYLPYHNNKATFDCRVYQVPTLNDACSQLLWRENDATKNSIQALAQSLYSHKSLHGLNSNQLQDKMFTEKGVNWNDLPARIKRGAYFKKVTVKDTLTQEIIDKLPEKHHLRQSVDLTVERNVIQKMDWEPLSKIEDRVKLIFDE